VFFWLFRNDLRGSYEDKLPSFAPEKRAFFRVAVGGVAGVLKAFFLTPLFRIPIGSVALAAGEIVVIVARLGGG
jgi:Na+/H+ antiporter NhaD/arsenite permease-like protein